MKKSLALSAIVLASGSAMASFDASYTGFDGVSGAFEINGRTYAAGHINYAYDGAGDRGIGQFADGSFSSFCIELQDVAGGSRTYDIIDLESAPQGSGDDYDSDDVIEVSRVLHAAVAEGWINSDLSKGAGVTNTQLAAIQGLIWQNLFDGASFSILDGSVSSAMGVLQARIDNYVINDSHTSFSGLRAMVNGDVQDQLFVVPLPPAALAGLITLGGIAGVKRLRRS